MSKKNERKVQRRHRMEGLAQVGELSCLRHDSVLTPRDIRQHRCYIGRTKTGYCKYLEGYK